MSGTPPISAKFKVGVMRGARPGCDLHRLDESRADPKGILQHHLEARREVHQRPINIVVSASVSTNRSRRTRPPDPLEPAGGDEAEQTAATPPAQVRSAKASHSKPDRDIRRAAVEAISGTARTS